MNTVISGIDDVHAVTVGRRRHHANTATRVVALNGSYGGFGGLIFPMDIDTATRIVAHNGSSFSGLIFPRDIDTATRIVAYNGSSFSGLIFPRDTDTATRIVAHNGSSFSRLIFPRDIDTTTRVVAHNGSGISRLIFPDIVRIVVRIQTFSTRDVKAVHGICPRGMQCIKPVFAWRLHLSVDFNLHPCATGKHFRRESLGLS